MMSPFVTQSDLRDLNTQPSLSTSRSPTLAISTNPTNTPLNCSDTSLSRKRKHLSSPRSLVGRGSAVVGAELDPVILDITEKRHATSYLLGVRPPPLVHPKSLYKGHKPPLPRTKERSVLKEIIEVEGGRCQFADDEYLCVDLEDFSIYRPHKTRISESSVFEKLRSDELVSLQELNSKGTDLFLLDGTIRFGPTGTAQNRRYVEGVPVKILSIGSYEDETLHSVGSNIWLQSIAGKGQNVWYRLTRPASEYLRYHEPFIWLSNLAKYVIDFLHTHDQVSLRDFREAFLSRLQQVHGSNQSFTQWLSLYPSKDFRHAVAAHAAFLYNQAGQLGPEYALHPLWGEIDPGALTAIPRQPETRQDHRTVVTPYVFECFKHLPWARFLDPVSLPEQPGHTGTSSVSDPQIPPTEQDLRRVSQDIRITSVDGPIQTGDVVAVRSDSNTAWKSQDKFWYAYVQGRKVTTHGNQLRLIWIYRPTDTACQDMKYPYANELFLSDHCNCGDGPIYTADVAHKVSVSLFGSPQATNTPFLIRQKYSGIDSSWTTFRTSDFQCRCNDNNQPLMSAYSVGSTLLVKATTSAKGTLEPVVLLGYATDVNPRSIRVRKLLRKRDDCGDIFAQSNEVVYSNCIYTCDISKVIRHCHVRFYTKEDLQEGRIPGPYNRNGTGDCFYIISPETGSHGDLEAVRQRHPVTNQGFQPGAAALALEIPPMRGLDLFAGGGNFGRGLEEAGVIKMEWAVDHYNEAMHTYHANSDGPCKLYNGSVNDYLLHAIHRRCRGLIAQRGEVDFIGAGNPCQGFSLANRLYGNETSLLNISLVASVLAFVDFYRPKYVCLENVLGMARDAGENTSSRQGNVFAQVLCVLVGLGYQTRPWLGDAWTYIASQSRTRLFIFAAAPGLMLPEVPAASHSHPDGVVGRSLGKTSNGLSFGNRDFSPTPFDYVTIGEATEDLPENVDARTACISYPDHRTTRSFSVVDNIRLSCVPRFPPGMTFVKSAKLGWQPPAQMAEWHWQSTLRGSVRSKAWQRAKSNALLPTVTTENAPNEALTGSALHWDENRPLTVMEARRAQGFPDDEVIIGTPAAQWKIIGNSVNRQTAIAIGMSYRSACLLNQDRDHQNQLWQTIENETERGPAGHSYKNIQSHLAEGEHPPATPVHEAPVLPRLPNSTLSTGTATRTGTSDRVEASSRESSVSTVEDREPLKSE